MSNSLKRLRALFDDPLLVRTSEGMAPTELALEIQPAIREILFNIERDQTGSRLRPEQSSHLFESWPVTMRSRH